MLVVMMLVVVVVLGGTELEAMLVLVLVNHVWLNMVVMVAMRMNMWRNRCQGYRVLQRSMAMVMMMTAMLVAFRVRSSFRLQTILTLLSIMFLNRLLFLDGLFFMFLNGLLPLLLPMFMVIIFAVGCISHIRLGLRSRIWRVMTTMAVQLSPFCLLLLTFHRVAARFPIFYTEGDCHRVSSTNLWVP